MEAIATDIKNELKRVGIEVDAVKRKLDRLKSEKDPENRDSHVTAVASILQSIYNGYEKILEMLIKAIDGELPAARDYHTALLKRASTPIPEIRPSIITEKTFNILDNIRRYRHVFRRIYHYQLKADRIIEVAELCIKSYDVFGIEIDKFLKDFIGGRGLK